MMTSIDSMGFQRFAAISKTVRFFTFFTYGACAFARKSQGGKAIQTSALSELWDSECQGCELEMYVISFVFSGFRCRTYAFHCLAESESLNKRGDGPVRTRICAAGLEIRIRTCLHVWPRGVTLERALISFWKMYTGNHWEVALAFGTPSEASGLRPLGRTEYPPPGNPDRSCDFDPNRICGQCIQETSDR